MRRVALLAALASLCAACGSAAAPTSAPPSKYAGFELKPPTPAPSFALADQGGHVVGPTSYRGHWLVVAFLYTHCPDVCPLVASQLGVAMRRDPGLRVLAVSVDPKRDTPAAIRTFLRERRAPAAFRFVGGTHARLARVWKAYHVAALPGPQGTVSHSTFELLIDPQGQERLLYDAELTATKLRHDLRLLAAS